MSLAQENGNLVTFAVLQFRRTLSLSDSRTLFSSRNCIRVFGFICGFGDSRESPMGPIRLVYGLTVSTFPDVMAGLLLAHVALKVPGHEGLWLLAYPWGVFWAVAPDLDAALQIFSHGELDTRHRDRIHKPLVLVGIALLSALVFPFFGLIAAACLVAHFLDYSIGNDTGWGIKWLWPFSENQYGFFQVKDGRRRPIAIWTPREIAKIRPLPLNEWLEKCYIHFCFSSVRSWVSLTLAIGIVTPGIAARIW